MNVAFRPSLDTMTVVSCVWEKVDHLRRPSSSEALRGGHVREYLISVTAKEFRLRLSHPFAEGMRILTGLRRHVRQVSRRFHVGSSLRRRPLRVQALLTCILLIV